MANVNCVITAKVSWWVCGLYIPALRCFFWMAQKCMGLEIEPDKKKIAATIMKGIKLYAGGKLISC